MEKNKTNIIAISGKIGSGKDTVGQIIQYLVCLSKDSLLPHQKDFSDFYKAPFSNTTQSGWEVKKMAGKLKEVAAIILGVSVNKFEDRNFKESKLGPEWGYIVRNDGRICSPNEIPNEEYTEMTVREFLQKIGTDAMRNGLHPDTWLNAFWADYVPTINKSEKDSFKELVIFGKTEIKVDLPNWIITDLRFENELQSVVDRKGITIRVNRFKIGDVIYWDDPEQGLSSGVYKIKEVNNEEAWIIQQDCMAEAQVPINEIYIFKDPEHPSEIALDNADFNYYINNNGTISDLIESVKEILIKENII